jgi:hypothetical protein
MELGILSCFDANNMRDDNYDVPTLINNLYNKEKVIISRSTDPNEILFPVQIDMKNNIFRQLRSVVSVGEVNRAQFTMTNDENITYSFKAERLTNQLFFFFEIDDNGNKKIYKNIVNPSLPFYIGIEKVSIPFILCENNSVTEVIYLHFMPRIQIIKPPTEIITKPVQTLETFNQTTNSNVLIVVLMFSLLYLFSHNR